MRFRHSLNPLRQGVVAVACASALGLAFAACCPEPVVADAPKAPVAPPDQDQDGVADADDRCPAVAGSLQYSGCPDTDADGIADDVDRCPEARGVEEHKGCPPPDADADTVLDADDACMNDKGPVETKGCPDRDMDLVRDLDDKCPDQAGTAAEMGCLPAEVQKFSGSIKGITFDQGKATIRKASFKTLDEAVAVLTKYETLRVEVQGHTDDQGDDAKNMELSQARADSVKTYLTDKGVAADRVDAKGFGETAPVADNKKAAGRAQNRRIEFKILGGMRRNLNP
jgi:outer membrane protein OmpA-like peptidoglycan-associated protein